MEVIALAGPLIALERDAMAAVVAAEPDVEAFETDPLGLFGVTLRLLDLGDEARVHADPPPLRHVPAGAGRGDSRPGLILVAPPEKTRDFPPCERSTQRRRRDACAGRPQIGRASCRK